MFCLKDLCYGATYYADRIHEKLKQAGYYDEIGQFDVTEQVSNNEMVMKGLVKCQGFVISIALYHNQRH